MREKRTGWQLYCLIPLLYLGLATAVVAVVSRNGGYPTGSDTMYHIFRGDMVYQALRRGDLWSSYTPLWYNGVEILRYWPPLPAYFMALCQAAAGGDPMNGYLLFVGAVCFFGALPWLWIGERLDRPLLGGFLGGLWFFLPNNLRAVFQEGNLARSLSMIFLPIFLYLMEEYLRGRNWKPAPGMVLSFVLMLLCHLGYAGMLALAVLLFLLVNRIFCGKTRGADVVILSMVLGFLLTGIWSLAALRGGISNIDSSESMAGFFQDFLLTLNPVERFSTGSGYFYFGLAAFLLALFGILGSGKQERPGFVTAVLLCCFTASSAYYVFRMLPGGQYLWMLRFISIALCLILLSFLWWKTLKLPLALALCVLLVLDVLPSVPLMTDAQSGELVEERMAELQEATLIDKGQELTTQRLALLDESALEARGAYLVSDWGNGVPAAFGAGWEAAATSSNIVQLNKAYSQGKFLYLFDRCKELGNDTVLIYERRLPADPAAVEKLDAAAEQTGYELSAKSPGYRLYHLETGAKNWGTKTKYPAIAIGSGSAALALDFPAMKETDSDNLNDYTFEELSQYQVVYLAGFTYNDRESAEELVLRLSEAGVRVVISADDIPEDRAVDRRTFLGVTCNPITFSNGYPELDTVDGVINADLFPSEHSTWDTVFLNGLDNCWGKLYDNGLEMEFFGTVKNENIVFVGINLSRFYGLTEDAAVGKLLSRAMELSSDRLPERTIVPLEISQTSHEICIDSPEDGVNTSIAYHDSFVSEQSIEEYNHLTYVGKGETVISIKFPYLLPGAVLSILGLALTIAFVLFLRARSRKAQDQSAGEEEADERSHEMRDTDSGV